MLKKIRTDRLFSKLSVGAYIIVGVLFILSLFFSDIPSNVGEVIGTVSVVFYFVGIIFQVIQLFLDVCFENSTLLTKEDAEELIKWIKEQNK